MPESLHTRRLALAACTLVALAGCQSRPYADLPSTPTDTNKQITQASAIVREAQRYELAGNDTEAIAKYREAINTYTELPVAWNNLGRLLMKRSENLGAADAFKTASELSPTDPRPLYNLGALWEGLGYLEDAQRWYNQALNRDHDYLPALRRYIIIEEIFLNPDPTTFERVQTALLIEKDPWWIDRFKRARQRFTEAERERRADGPAQ